MKIVIIDDSGPVGPRLVARLNADGHETAILPSSSNDSPVACQLLAGALSGAAVVVDLSVAPEFTRLLLELEAAAGVGHHLALSAVGIEHLLESDHFQALYEREQLIKASSTPYSIVRATALFESLGAIANAATQGMAVHLPSVLVQPIAADDVVRLIAPVAVTTPLNGTVEIGGPEPFYLDGLVQRVLGARRDPRRVIPAAHAGYFGGHPGERTLVAGDEAGLGEIRFDDWLCHASAHAACGGAAWPAAPARVGEYEFRLSDVPPGSVLLVGDKAVFSVPGGFCATQATCTHRAGPLSEGTVDGVTVTCPLHGAQFNIWSGAVLRGPAVEPLQTYRVNIDGDIGRVEETSTDDIHIIQETQR